MLADGETFDAIVEGLGCRPTYVLRWKKRFLEHSLAVCTRAIWAKWPRCIFTSKGDLARTIMRYIKHHDVAPEPIRRTYSNPERRIGGISSTVTVHWVDVLERQLA